METATETTLDGSEEALVLLREQDVLYAKLERFAARQRTLVTGDDPGPLLSLLADRQRLSTELAGIARRLEPVRRAWATYRERLTQPQRIEADRLLEDAAQRLRRVIESDEQDARLLSIRKESAGATLRATHAAGFAIDAYRAPAGQSNRLDFLDGGGA
jgi:hypothetical protein